MELKVKIRKKLSSFVLDADFETDIPMALLGASGSGKSMTLKCIAGIEKPDSGTIILNGRTLFDSDRRINLSPQKRNIGYLFQNYALRYYNSKTGWIATSKGMDIQLYNLSETAGQ